VELADGATSLPRLEPAKQRTIVLLGHEHHGIPVGLGASLNVAVAGSLVLYRLAGMA
jgi:tRNA G18 (ribose-2'-O)-methylase SpoU